MGILVNSYHHFVTFFSVKRPRPNMTTQGPTALIKICLPVQGNGADAFNLALYLISSGLEGVRPGLSIPKTTK